MANNECEAWGEKHHCQACGKQDYCEEPERTLCKECPNAEGKDICKCK